MAFEPGPAEATHDSPGHWEALNNRSTKTLQNGGADGIRTHDLLDAIEARSQLRHGPTEVKCLP